MEMRLLVGDHVRFHVAECGLRLVIDASLKSRNFPAKTGTEIGPASIANAKLKRRAVSKK